MKNFCTGSSLVFLIVVLSCAGEDINLTCADPLGTDAETIQLNALSCFQASFDGCFEFRWNESSGYIIQSVYVSYPDPDPSEAPLIVDLGYRACLSEVVQRPTSGWQYSVPAEERHGYVFKMKDGSLGRLFIDSWETSGSNVAKINITRQYPY